MKDWDPETVLQSQPWQNLSVGELHELIVDMEGSHRRKMAPVSGCYRLRVASLGSIRFCWAESPAVVRISTARAMAGTYVIQFPWTSVVRLEAWGTEFEACPPKGIVLSPGQPCALSRTAGWVLAIEVEASLVRRRVFDRIGSCPSASPTFHPLIEEANGELRNLCTIMVDEIDQGRLIPGSLSAKCLQKSFVDLLLECQPHSQSTKLALEHSARRSSCIDRVRALVERNPGESIDLDGLAQACALSKRSLQSVFRDILGYAPLTYVRKIRMAMARDMLRRRDGAATVAEAAAATGFAHLGRFSAEYARVYGESPSQTLGRRTEPPEDASEQIL